MASSAGSPGTALQQQPSPPHDALDIAQKLGVLTAIQQDLASTHLREAFVLSVIASWPTTLQVSWVNGGFAGGAAVVLLSDFSRALVLLAGSRQQHGGGGASPASSFRIVGSLCASELLAHGGLSIEDLDAARSHVLATTTTATAPETAPASSGTMRPAVAKFAPVMLAYTTAAEKARYVFLERCPPFAVDALFDAAVFHPLVPTLPDANDGQRPSQAECRVAIPLGAFASRPISSSPLPPTNVTATPAAGSSPAAAPPPATNASPPAKLHAATHQLTSLSAFRSAVLADIRQSVFVFVSAAGATSSSRDFAAVASADLALEVLWCLAGCTRVYFSLEVTVRAATLPVVVEGSAQSSGSASAATSTTSGGGRNNPSADLSAAGGATSATSGAATAGALVVESKERVLVVCWASLVLLKKKSAFPPPLWCMAFAWYHVEKLIVPASLATATTGKLHDHSTTLVDAAALPSNVSAKDLYVTVCLNPAAAVAVGGGGNVVEEQLVISFPTAVMLHMFVSACCEAFSDFTGGSERLSIVPRLNTAQQQQQRQASSNNKQQPPPVASQPPQNFCRIWTSGSDLDAPSRRYPLAVFQGSSVTTTVGSQAPSSPQQHQQQRMALVGLHQEEGLRSLSALSSFVTEHPSVFLLLVQWAMASGSLAMGGVVASTPCASSFRPRRGQRHGDGVSAAASPAGRDDGEPVAVNDTGGSDARDDGAEAVVETFFSLASVQTPHVSILSAIAMSLALHFAQLPNPLAGNASKSTATATAASPAPDAMPPGRLLELFAAALSLHACVRTLRTAQLPPLPSSAHDIIRARIGLATASSSSVDVAEGDRRNAAGTPPPPPSLPQRATDAASAAPPLSVMFFVCRWAVAIAFRNLFARMHRQAIQSNGENSLVSGGRHSPSRSARGGSASPLHNLSTSPATSPPGSPTTASEAVATSPLRTVLGMLDALPRDPKVLAEYRPIIQQLVARWVAATASSASTMTSSAASAATADALVHLSVMFIDVLAERALAHVAKATGQSTASLLPSLLLMGKQNTAGSPTNRGTGGPGAHSILAAQQTVVDWLSYVIKGSGGAITAAAVSSFIAPCEPFSLRSLMQHANMSDDLLFSRAYGVGTSSTSSLASIPLRLAPFRWSALTLASGRASPMRQLQAYFDSGSCALWKSVVTAMMQAPIATGALERMSLQLAANAMGSKSATALLHRRTAATQTTRTSAQEAKLLEDHLALRSRVVLPVHPNVLADEAVVGRNTKPRDTNNNGDGVRRRKLVGGEQDGDNHDDDESDGPAAVADDDLETNKALLHRVIALEKKLLKAHNRNAVLQEELQQAHATSRVMLGEQAVQWERDLAAHTARAQRDIAQERRLVTIEREACRREALVHSECQGWFQLTSSLFLALMG